MLKRSLALGLTLVLILTSLPVNAIAASKGNNSIISDAGQNPANFPVSQEDIVLKPENAEIDYDEKWNKLYPYGTFAFADAGSTICEGAKDGSNTAFIPVYRIGGTDGTATVIVKYSPTVYAIDENHTSFSWAISSEDDIELSYEKASPLTDYQKISMPEIVPAPAGAEIGADVYDGEGAENSEKPVKLYPVFPEGKEVKCIDYQWQYHINGYSERDWVSLDNAKDPALIIDLCDISDNNGDPMYDYRLIYQTEDGYFCTPSLFDGKTFDPSSYDALDVPDDIDLTDNGEFEKLVPSEKFAGYEFPITFGDGEWVKYIKATALDNSEYELDEMGVFTLYECIGGQTSDLCNTYTITISDDDDNDIRESTIGFETSKISVSADEDSVMLQVKRTGDLRYMTTVSYTTEDGTAKAGKQYAQVSGDLMFGPDNDTETIEIPLISGDSRTEEMTFSVSLSAVRGGNGACTVSETAGKAEITLPSTAKSINTRQYGMLGAGNNISSVLAMPENAEFIESEESETPLLYDGSLEGSVSSPDDDIELIEAAGIKEGSFGIYDYDAVRLRRTADYAKSSIYWKNNETPYYSDPASSVNDSVNYILRGATFNDKGELKPKSDGLGILSANYDTKTPAALDIKNAGYLFSHVQYKFDVTKVATCGQFLGIGYNYTMPWLNVKIGQNKTFCDFDPQDSESHPLKKMSFSNEQDLSFAPEDFHIDMNMTLNDAGEDSTKHESFVYVPGGKTVLQLSDLDFTRRQMTGTANIALRIFTANDDDSDNYVLAKEVYNSLRPKVTLVPGASGVTEEGFLYAGSRICVTLGYAASFRAYNKGENPDKTVFVTRLDGTAVPASVESSDGNSYYITFLWDNITEADLAAEYRINVVYERAQNISFDISPSLERDQAGNVRTDAESVGHSWENVFKNGSKETTVKVTYSKYDPTAGTDSGFVTKELSMPFSEIIADTSTPKGVISAKDTGVTNIQSVNFGLPTADVILFNGEQYAGDETILLCAAELTMPELTFTFYDEQYLNVENIMNLSISHKELYCDTNANGKIDGYYDQASGLFILDEKSGDTFCGIVGNEIPDDVLQPMINIKGNVAQYFFKVYYTMTPRALRDGEGTAQIIPAFVPQNTDAVSLSKLTYEQKSYRMIKAGATEIAPFDKSTGERGKAYSVPDTSEGHAMFGAAATKQTTLDIPLGGDVRSFRKVKINGIEKTLDLPDYAGNLKFGFADPETFVITNLNGDSEEITDVNGYLGSFINNTSFVVGVQETREMKSQDDFNAESVTNGDVYAVPASNTAAIAGATKDQDASVNVGGTANMATELADLDTELLLPTMSLSALGVSANYLNNNQLLVSFGLTLFQTDFLKKDTPTETKTEVEGDEKKTTETEKKEDGTVEKETVTNKDNKSVISEQTTVKKETTVSDGEKESVIEQSFTQKENKDGSKEASILIEDKTTGDKLEIKDEAKAGEELEVLGEGFEKKVQTEKSGYFSDYLKKSLANSFDLADYIDAIKEYRKNKTTPFDEIQNFDKASNKWKKSFTFTLILQAYAVFEYNPLEGGWGIAAANASLTGVLAFSAKVRIPMAPLFYFFVNVTITVSAGADWEFANDYKTVEEIVPDGMTASETYSLANTGDSILFEVDTNKNDADGFRMKLNGKAYMKVSTDPDFDELALKGTLNSDGTDYTDVNLEDFGSHLYVLLTAKENGVSISELNTVKCSLESSIDNGSLYAEFNFEIGLGAGIDLAKVEAYFRINAKATLPFRPTLFVDNFTLHGAVSFRIRFLMFEFSMSLVGVTFTGKRENGYGSPMEYSTYFEKFGEKERLNSSADEVAVGISAPTSSASTQELFSSYTPREGENAFHPTDTDVKFELSGYSGTGDAFKLADHLNGGYTYKGIEYNGETYILYMISDPRCRDNTLNASRLVLSKVVTIGENPGIQNPFDENSDTPYVMVDSQSDPLLRTGDLSFDCTVKDGKLTVVYTCYDTHFTSSDVLSVEDAGKHTVVKKTSVDLSDPASAAFETPVKLTGHAETYRFMPVSTESAVFYGETVNDTTVSQRDADLRAYMKAVYGINDEDYTDKDVDASKAQMVYRYLTQKAQRDLLGDSSRIAAVKEDGTVVNSDFGTKSGEILTQLKAVKIDSRYAVFYITEQDAYFGPDGKTQTADQFDENTDYAVITRLYMNVFNGTIWHTAKLLRQTVNFEHFTSSSSDDCMLRDGVYENGSLVREVVDPSISNIAFLSADLDGEGVKPVFTVEMDDNTYLINNENILRLVNGRTYTMQPIFSAETGTGLTIAADKNGNMAMAYIKVMDGTDSNAVYCAWWDKELGTWGEGSILAMNHLSVYENSVKYRLSAEQLEKAYLGDPTGNAEYDEYTNGENSEKGALDRFVFSRIQMLPSTQTYKFGDGRTEEREQLILLTDGTYSELEKGTHEVDGEEEEYLYESENYGNGFYAISFGSGEQAVGNASVEFDSGNFSCGTVLTGTASFTNIGSAAIRGSADQPVSVKLIAVSDDTGYYQVLDEFNVNYMIPSGSTVSLDFSTQPLQENLPSGTEFVLYISEDAEYISGSGGTAFSSVTDPLYTIRGGADIGIESLEYELISMDDDFVTVGTEFVVVNRGNETADGLFVQYSAVENKGDESEKLYPLDLTGSELRVSNETVITENYSNDVTNDIGAGVIALVDENGDDYLSSGYMRTVTGTLKIARDDFSRFGDKGLDLRCTLYSDSDNFTVNNDQYEKLGTKETARSDNAVTKLLSHDTSFSVPSNISMNLDNTLRVPIAFTSTNVDNDVVIREITDGSESWTSLFNDVYFDVSHKSVVATARKTGHTIIQIEDRETNSFREIAVTVKNDGYGINIFNDDNSFTFMNADGSDVKDDPIHADWDFRSDTKTWSGDYNVPMSEDYCYANKAGASVSFETVGTTLTVHYSGKIEVTSDLYPDKVFTGDNTGKTDEPLVIRFDNLDGKRQTVTIKALTEGTELDKYTAAYPEDTGVITKSDMTSPNIYWSRSFPNTASVLNGEEIAIDYFAADETGVASVTVNGVPVEISGPGQRLIKLSHVFSENGQYTFTVTDIDGNTTKHSFGVHWFGDHINKDALSECPDFRDSDVKVLDGGEHELGENRAERVIIATSYDPDELEGELFRGYTNGNGTVSIPENEVNVAERPFSDDKYTAGIDAKTNGFYIMRVVAENGTWSQTVLDIDNLITAETALNVELSEDGKALEIEVDAQKTGVVPLYVKVNGYKLSPAPTELLSRYVFPITCGGTYEIEVFNGTDTYRAKVTPECKVTLENDGIIAASPVPEGAENGLIMADTEKLSGGTYDPALSDPAKNVYKVNYEFALVEGEKETELRNGTAGTWGDENMFENLKASRYTLGIRDKNDPDNVHVTFVTIGKTPKIDGEFTIDGEMSAGSTVKAVISESDYLGTLSYQWYRTKDGTEEKIEGADKAEYTVTEDDFFCYLTCKVTSSYETGVLSASGTDLVTVGAEGWDGEYDGKPHGISVNKTEREDVTVSYTVTDTVPGKAPTFTDAGEYTVDYYLVTNPPRYIPGTTRYYGDMVASSEKVTIARRDISSANIVFENVTYDGTEKQFKIRSITAGGVNVTNYDITGELSGVNAGKYTITVTGKGNFCGSITLDWEILPKDIRNAEITLEETAHVFDFTEQTCSVEKVTIGALTVDTYTVSGNKATDAGDYTLTVSGTGNYTGKAVITWTVAPLDITGAEIKPAEHTFLYSGENITIAPEDLTVTLDGKNIPVDANASVSGNEGTDKGLYTLSIDGSGNYTGRAKTDWRIVSDDFANAVVTFEEKEILRDGKEHTPVIKSVTVDGIPLDPDDYTVSGQTSGSEAGTYEITLTAKEPLHGAVTAEWKILSNDIKDATVVFYDTTYNGKDQTCRVKDLYMDGRRITSYTVTGEKTAKNAGDHLVTIIASGAYEGTLNAYWTIDPRDITYCTAVPETFTYNGAPQDLKFVSVKVGELDAEYDLMGKIRETDAGTYDAVIVGTGNFCGQKKVEWTISRKDITGAEVKLGTTTYNARIHNPPIESVTIDGIDVTYRIFGETQSISAGKHVLTIEGTGNFCGQINTKWEILPCDLSECTITSKPIEYSGGEVMARAYIRTPDGQTLDTYTYSSEFNVKNYKATEVGNYVMTVTSRGNNFSEGTFEVPWEIIPRDISDARVNLERSKFVYTGEDVTCNVLSVYDGTTKVTDFEVTGNVEKDIGKHQLTITGHGNFTGSVTAEWQIAPATSAHFLTYADYELDEPTYNGKKQTCTIRIFVNGQEVDDYTVSGNTGTDAGEYELTVYGTGKYEGEVFKIPWRIAPKHVDSSDIIVAAEDPVFNGTKQTCAIKKITVNGVEITDYDVVGNTASAPGEYEMTVTLKGNYSGSVTVKWSVLPSVSDDPVPTPVTGDTSSAAMWAVLMLVSAIGILLASRKRKKNY